MTGFRAIHTHDGCRRPKAALPEYVGPRLRECHSGSVAARVIGRQELVGAFDAVIATGFQSAALKSGARSRTGTRDVQPTNQWASLAQIWGYLDSGDVSR